jgi:alkylhydroperoxidase family enzyme
MTAADVETLRATGLTDEEISDAAQVVAYFNYINRIADGLGCELEADMPPRGEPSP